jgi:uncharacterized protein (TIGR03437 family)
MPTTPGAFQPAAPVISNFNVSIAHGFFAAIAAAGDRFLFSTYFTGGASARPGIAGFITTAVTAIGVDPTGAIVIAGVTNVSDLPVTAGAYAQQCACNSAQDAGFVARFSPGAASLAWATYLPAAGIRAIALQSSGSILLSGTAQRGLATTPDALQPAYPPASSTATSPAVAGFLARLDGTGSNLLYATYFGGNEIARFAALSRGIGGMSIDTQGTIWITGTSAPAALPATPEAVLGQNYIASLSSDARAITALYTAPDGGAGTGVAAGPQGTVAALGYPDSLLIARSSSGPSLLGIAGTPEFHVAPAVAPRELVSIYGIDIGPANPLSAQVNNGLISASLGGVQVLFDGQPAALIYAGPTQINAIVPSAVATRQSTAVQIVTSSGTIAGPTLTVQRARPLTFSDVTGHVTAINQDGSFNSASNPAPSGSVIAMWMTGAGGVAGEPDNRVNTSAEDNLLPIAVLSSANAIGGGLLSLEVLYGGDAPQLPSGVTQVNFRIPTIGPILHGRLDFQIEVGGIVSDPLYVYVQ